MMDKHLDHRQTKTLVIITSAIVLLLIITFSCVAVYVSMREKEKFNQEQYVVIYRYNVKNYNIDFSSEPEILYKELFTDDLQYDEKIYTQNLKGYNHITISQGVIKIIDANCHNKTCQQFTISKDNLLANRSITCAPHGIVIELEVKE